jgi:hypothetical protein
MLDIGYLSIGFDLWLFNFFIHTIAEEPYPDVSPYDMLDYLHEGNRMNRPEHCSIEM